MKEKKKFELSATEISLILYALSIVIVVVAYFTFFNPKMSDAKAMEAQNVVLQGQVDGLESMVAREADVVAETASYKKEVQDIIAKYPVDVPTEKAIKLLQDMQDINEIDISDFSISPANMVASVSNVSASDINASTTDGAEGEEGSEQPVEAAPVAATGVGYFTVLSAKYEASYEAFKELIWYISHFESRMTAPSVTMASDSESGLVSGTITIKMYYLTGTGKEYLAPELDEQATGVSNIFGVTVGSLKNNDADKASVKDDSADKE